MNIRGTTQLYRDAFSDHPREIWVLAWFTLINRIGTMVLPFLAVYATTVLHFSLRETGLLVAAFGLGSLGGSYFGGILTDRIGGRKVILMSLFFGGLMLISIQWARTLEVLFTLIFIAALFGEAYRPALSTLVAQYVPKAKFARSMAFIRLAINLGFSLAPTIGGFVAAGLGYSWLFWIDGLSCVGAAAFFMVVSRGWLDIFTKKEDRAARKLISGIGPLKNKMYLIFLISTLCMAFTFVQWFHTVPVFIKSVWGYDERVIGLLMGISSGIIVLIEMPIIHRLESQGQISRALRLGLVLLALSFVPFQFPGALIWCFVAMLFFTLGEILYLPLNNSFSLLLSPDERRGEYMSWYWMGWSTANILGPSLGFLLIDWFGYPFFWAFLLVVLGVSWVLNYRVHT